MKQALQIIGGGAIILLICGIILQFAGLPPKVLFSLITNPTQRSTSQGSITTQPYDKKLMSVHFRVTGAAKTYQEDLDERVKSGDSHSLTSEEQEQIRLLSNAAKAEIMAKSQEIVDQLPPNSYNSFRSFSYQPYFSLQVNQAGIEILQANPDVISVSEEGPPTMTIN